MQKCVSCKLYKNFDLFYRNKSRKTGFDSRCKDCMKNYQKNNKSILKKHRKKYYKKSAYKPQRMWQKNNPDKMRIKWMKIHKRRYGIDISYTLRILLRSRLRTALKRNQKSGSAVKDLGCSIEKFKLWLEMHFEEGMTWDNHNLHGWHIDHKKPLDSFDLTNKEQLLEACHFTNLQPMWAKENLSKNNKILGVNNNG